jgi:hypothetical protein
MEAWRGVDRYDFAIWTARAHGELLANDWWPRTCLYPLQTDFSGPDGLRLIFDSSGPSIAFCPGRWLMALAPCRPSGRGCVRVLNLFRRSSGPGYFPRHGWTQVREASVDARSSSRCPDSRGAGNTAIADEILRT